MMGKKISPDMRREIEALSREGLPQKEIAARTNVCIDTCRMVEKDLGLQRQPAKRTRGPVTEQEKKEIRRLHKKGWFITSIAKRLGVGHKTVASHIKRMGLVALVPRLPEEKMLSMRRRGFTQREIARRLKLNRRRTFQFFRRNGFARPRYRRFQPSTKQLIEIIDLAMTGNDSAKSIARKLSLPYDSLLKLIHKIRQCSKFLPTAALSSYLPMKHRDQIGYRACEEESMMYLLDCVRRACADCHLTPDPRRLVAVAIAVCAQLYLRERAGVRIGYTAAEEQKIVDSLTPRFANALDTLRTAEDAVVH